MPNLKIHAFIAQNSIYSRRKAEELIEAGSVTVNDQKAKIGQRVSEQDTVKVKNKVIKALNKKIIYLINKPVGVVSTTSDELGRKTVLDLIPKQKEKLYPVGRLDIDSEGLMILTNDGDMAYKYTHPKFEVAKVYQVKLNNKISDKAFNLLRRGVRLKDGFTKPDKVEIIEDEDKYTVLEVTLHEGRNREIRRLMYHVGYEVDKLVRVRLGSYKLSDLGDKVFIEK